VRKTWSRSRSSGANVHAQRVRLLRVADRLRRGYRTAITPDGDWQFFVAGD